MDTLAAYITALGPADRIEIGNLPVATPGPTDVLVRTAAMAVNNVDTLVRSGAYRTPTPFPFIIGRDMVGTVVTAGPGASGFTEGDRVWCNSLGHGGRQGSFAEYVVVAADRLYHLAADVDPIRAVAVLHTAGTASLGLFRDARLRAGDTIIVGGGAGGVGSAVVQLAAASGAHVIATAAAADADWCRASGAAQVFDYRDQGLLPKLAEVAPDGADVYWDTSGHLDYLQSPRCWLSAPGSSSRPHLTLAAGFAAGSADRGVIRGYQDDGCEEGAGAARRAAMVCSAQRRLARWTASPWSRARRGWRR